MRISSGTRAIVTGASKGIGRAVAAELASRGARVGLLARSGSELERLAAELPGEGHVVLACDVGDRAAVAEAVETFAEQAGGIDLLVANAGVAYYAPYTEQALDDAEEMVRVNVLGVLYVVKAALGRMLDAPPGHIVVISSGAGLRSFPEAAVYGATKAADKGFAEALRHELAGTGIDVTTVFPGEIETELHSHERDSLPEWRANDRELPAPKLARAVVEAVEEGRRNAYVPGAVRLLGLNGIVPRLTDFLLARIRGRAAAPRTD